tara:strand:+ start:1341 stop:1550 length:210 start_codon:yes stop_codon:yes gene_type:complete
MNFAENYLRLFVVSTVLSVEAINGFQTGLDPAVKLFIGFTAIVGPLAITGVIFLLKKIEKDDPERIRWK